MNPLLRDSSIGWKAAAILLVLLLLGPSLATAQDSEVILQTYQDATATASQSGSTSASTSGSGGVSHAWYDYDTQNVEYRAGCSVSLSAFASYDYVYVSSDQNAVDPDLPSDSSALRLSLDEYYCLFPVDQKEAAFQESTTEALDDPDFQAATTGMSDQERLEILVPNAAGADGAIGGHGIAAYAPAAGTGIEGHVTVGTSLTGETDLAELLPDTNPGAHASPVDMALDAAEDPPLPGPQVASAPSADSNGRIIVRVVLPTKYSYDSGGNRWQYYPSNGCSMDTISDIASYMTRTFRNGGQRLDIDAFCYVKLRYPWDPCVTTSGSTSCTRSTYSLFDRLKYRVDDKMSWMTYRSNAVVTSFIYSSYNNGIADQTGQYSLVSERALWKPDSPHTSILMHEWGHNFGAQHYPDDTYRKYYCRQKGSNNNWVYYDSVMNYCHMWHGWWRMDTTNFIRVHSQLW